MSKAQERFVEFQRGRSPQPSITEYLTPQRTQWLTNNPELLDHLIEIFTASERTFKQDRLYLTALRDGTTHTCETCGKTYAPTRSDAKFCSPPCRQKAYRTNQTQPPKKPHKQGG